MKRVYIASANPVKIAATRRGFETIFPNEQFEVLSRKNEVFVVSQPMGDKETLEGAWKRANNIRELAPDADYWVGIEGGCTDQPGGLSAFAWVVVLDAQRCGRGRSGEFFLPEKVAQLVRRGMELGDADDQVFSRNNSKQNNGAIGLLTDNAIDREGLYVPAVIFALVPFKNPELYP